MRRRTARKTTFREVSLCAIGADPNARIRTMPRDVIETPDSPANNNPTIRNMVRQAGLSGALADRLIDRGATLDEAQEVIGDALAARSSPAISTAHNNAGHENRQVTITAMAEALYAGQFPGHELSPQARAFAGIDMHGAMQELLRRSGEVGIPFSTDMLVTRILGAHTTSDFPELMGDTVGRFLAASYRTAPAPIRALAWQTTAPDFRERKRVLLDMAAELLKVREHGEYKNFTITEAHESLRVETYGRIIAFTRQLLTNNDLGGLADMAGQLGRNAGDFEGKALAKLVEDNPALSDGKPAFHADHGNTSPSPLDEAALTAATLAMRRQKGPGGSLVSVTPKNLLVPPELETAALKLVAVITPATAADANVFSNLSVVVEPRLTSPARWYLTADPAEIPSLAFAYLSGAPGPQVFTQVGWRIDGVEFKVRLDFGAAWLDHRGWYRGGA